MTRPRKYRVALLVDNPQRDLPGMVLVAWALAQRGATALLVPMNLRLQELAALAPDVVLLNHFRVIYENMVRVLTDAGVRVAVLDTEGNIFGCVPSDATLRGETEGSDDSRHAFEQFALSLARDKALRDKIDCYCSWTPAFAAYAAEAGWYRADQVTVTGTPRSDFYAPQWQQAALNMAPYLAKYPDPVILIAGSFPLANARFQTPEKESEWLKKNFDYSAEFVAKWRATQEHAMKGLATFANRAAREFPETTIIYRPHPFENEATYETLLEELPNLHLVREGTLDGWLLKAKALVHWASSSAVEAAMVDTPAFSAGWLPLSFPVPALEDACEVCSSEENLLARLAQVIEGTHRVPSSVAEEADRVIGETYYRIDGRSHARVADALISVAARKGPRPARGKLTPLLKGKQRPTLRMQAMAGAKRVCGLPADWSVRRRRRETYAIPWDDSPKRFDMGSVRQMIDAIQSCATEAGEGSPKDVAVFSALDAREYRGPLPEGRAMVVTAAGA